METNIKYLENGRLIAEFTDFQEYTNFIVIRTRRICEAEYILNQRKRDNRIKWLYWILGMLAGASYMYIILFFINH